MTIASIGSRSRPGLNDLFEEAIDDALSSLPADLRAAMSNVEIVVEDEPPDGQPLLGLYRGVPGGAYSPFNARHLRAKRTSSRPKITGKPAYSITSYSYCKRCRQDQRRDH
jgi:hypothetical protein